MRIFHREGPHSCFTVSLMVILQQFYEYYRSRMPSGLGREVGVDLFYEHVNIDAVNHACLLQSLALCGRATYAMHTCAHQNRGNFDIRAENLSDLHVLVNDHVYYLLTVNVRGLSPPQ